MDRKLYVISGPSGIGAGDIIADIFEQRSDVSAVIPVTARKLKAGERDGVGFFFFDLDGWNTLKEAGDLLESTEFAGNDYGTSRRLVQEKLSEGRHVILSLEIGRAAQVKQNMPEAVCIYMEPSANVLKERYRAVSRNSLELSVRLETAEKQRALSGFCDYRICSDDREAALSALNDILNA
ncbi:MAG: hypothetical protein K6C08_09485 [Oscillospiraceae bacterium]|nr:hypothetical protein [Oscillospiraceae bacterium]